MDIVIRRADPVTDSQDISNLIEICRSERRTILNSYSPQAEEAYIKNLSDSEDRSLASQGYLEDGLTLIVQVTAPSLVRG